MPDMRAPYTRGEYRVAMPFLFRGRMFEEGDTFNTRRLEPEMRRLQELYRDGFIEMPDPDEDAEYRAERQAFVDAWQPPQPKTDAVAEEEEDLEEEDDLDEEEEEDFE